MRIHRLESALAAVIFDMDGVLIDSEQWMLASSEEMLAELGVQVSKELLLKLTGSPVDVYRSRMSELIGISGEEFGRISGDYFRRKPIPFGEIIVDGARELLEWIGERGYPMALVTSDTKESTERKFAATGFGDFFAAVVTDEMVTHSKPHPESYLLAAELLGAEPERCLVVEDSARGVASGHSAGMLVAARRNAEVPQDISLADFQFDSLDQVKSLLNNYGKEWREI